MTTAAQTRAPGPGPGVAGRVVRRALVGTVLLGALLAVVAQVVSGTAALVGVLVGTALVCGFFGLGTVVLIWVTRVSPALSLIVGLMTYTLQVVLLGITFATLQASGLMSSRIDGTWLGSTVIAGTLVWLGVQVTVSLRARQPYFDLPAEPSATTRDEGRADRSERRSEDGPGTAEAGAR